jgi:hypothetical protein
MSISQADQFKQGFGTACIIIAGLSFTMTIFHLLRIRAAKKMVLDPIDTEVIKEHLKMM